MLATEFSGGGQVAQEFDHSVVEDVDHAALSGADGPDCAENRQGCADSTVADFGQSC